MKKYPLLVDLVRRPTRPRSPLQKQFGLLVVGAINNKLTIALGLVRVTMYEQGATTVCIELLLGRFRL